jgi:exonuclease V gamma subunit
MQLPGQYVWRVYRAVLGSDIIPEESSYDKERLMWRIFRLLPGLCTESVFDPLRRFLEQDNDLRKRSQLAGHLSGLYDQYQVYRADWLDACDQALLDEELTLAVVREHILARMKESSMSRRFLAGMVNFGALIPMRAIPFRVVCLLGMNDGDFPRSHPPLDFDLMAGKGLYRPAA